MNMIEYWASLVQESMDEHNVSENSHSMARPESNWGRGRFGTARPSELGRKIMGLFSPASFAEMEKGEQSPFYKTDFTCFITDQPGLRLKYPHAKNLDKLGMGLIAFFSCKAESLSPKLIVDSFNKWCGSVLPRRYTEEDLINLGALDMSGTRHGVRVMKDAYAINLTRSIGNGNKIDADSAMETFQVLKGDYPDADLKLQIGYKDEFEKYFSRNRQEFDILDQSRKYMVFFCFQGSMDEDDIVKLANDVNKSGEADEFGLAENGQFTIRDVTKVGFIRGRYSKSKNFENFDVFAVRTSSMKGE